jgi:rhamnosyltransferase
VSSEIVSIVIPTKDGIEFLPAVLEVLAHQRTEAAVEIVAVDSGSKDGTLELLKRYSALVRCIPAAEFNHGGTRNLGVRLAKGNPIVFLTQDAVPADLDFVQNIIRPFKDSRVAGVYGRQIPRANCDVVRRRQLEEWLTGRLEAEVSFLDGRNLADLHPFERHRFCTFDNVCSAIRRDVWQQIPFPYVEFGEDVMWGKKVIEAGWATAYEPTAAVFHSHRRSILDEYERTRICHRLLYRLFGMATVPRRSDVVRASMLSLRHDLPYVFRHAPSGAERVRQLFRIAGLSILSPLAQHQGYRDAAAGGRE